MLLSSPPKLSSFFLLSITIILTTTGCGKLFEKNGKAPQTGTAIAPNAPTNLAATTDVTDGSVTLVWQDNAANETGFKIYQANPGTGATTTIDVDANVVTKRLADVPANVTLGFCISAINSIGESPCSNQISVLVVPKNVTRPAAPSALTAKVESSARISFTWTDNSDNESGFELEKSTDGTTFTLAVEPKADATSGAIDGLAADTLYYFRARAVNGVGASDYSPIINARTSAATISITAPSTLTATTISSSTIRLAWKDNSNNESGFELDTTPALATKPVVNANATTIDVTGLSPQTMYSFKIRAYVTGGTVSDYSNVATATTQAAPVAIAAPTKLAATVKADNRIYFTWVDNSDNEDAFVLYERAANAGFTAVATVNQNETTTSLPKTNDGSFEYVVRAKKNGLGESADSNLLLVAFVATPAAPSNLVANAVGAKRVALAWMDNSRNETGFKLERSRDNFATVDKTWMLAADQTTFVDMEGVMPQMRYYYRVRAYRTGTSSDNSNVLTVDTIAMPPKPAAPGSAMARALPGSVIRLSWMDVAEETGYVVYRLADDGTLLNIGGVAANNLYYDVTGLAPNTMYRFQIGANNEAGETLSVIVSATTLIAPPTAPTGLTLTPVKNGALRQMSLNFSAVGASQVSFTVTRSTDAVNYSDIAQLGESARDYLDTNGIEAGRAYCYKVVAVNAGGTSPSQPICARAIPNVPQAPIDLVAAPASDISIIVTWSDSLGAPSAKTGAYVLRRKFGESVFVKIATVGAAVMAYIDGGLSASTKYDYKIVEYNEGGESTDSNIASATTIVGSAPGAPAGLIATAQSTSEISLAWRNTADAPSIEIERSPNGATAFAKVGEVTGNSTTYRDTSLSQSTLGYYRLRAKTAGGASGWSNVAVAKTSPLPITNLAATVLTNGSIRLDWTNASVATGLAIEFDAGNGFSAIPSIGGALKTHTFTGLVPDTSYRFRITAIHATTISVSSTVCATVVARTLKNKPDAPTGLAIGSFTQTTAKLTWTDNAETEDGFVVYRRQGTSSTLLPYKTLAANATTFEDTSLTAKTVYQYYVVALNNGGESPRTTIETVTTLPNPPAAPSNLARTAMTSTSVTLTWGDNATTETDYVVERSDDNGATFFVVDRLGVNVKTYTDVTNLVTDVTYQYRVRAHNIGGNSSPSNAVSAKLPDPAPGVPQDLTAVKVGAAYRLAWKTGASNTGKFELERASAPADGACAGVTAYAKFATVTASVDATDYGYSDATATLYCYRVRATTAAGTNPTTYSNIAIAR